MPPISFYELCTIKNPFEVRCEYGTISTVSSLACVLTTMGKGIYVIMHKKFKVKTGLGQSANIPYVHRKILEG